MDKIEKKVYQRELMRLRYAAKKAGLDEHNYSRDELLDMAEQGLIHPSGRKQKQVRHLVLPKEPKSPIAVVVTQRVYTSTMSKPKRPQSVSSEASELARALQWMIETAMTEFGLDKREVLERLSERLDIPIGTLRHILQGKEASQHITNKFKRVIQAYNDAHRDRLPKPVYLPAPESLPRETFPIAKNEWCTRIDQLNAFNKHGRTI